MKQSLGPCPKCRRHVSAGADVCPFCGVSRRGLLVAAGALLVAPDAAFAQDPQPAYGAARPPEHIAVWDRVFADWRTLYALGGSAESWAKRAPGTSVSYRLDTVNGKVDIRTTLVEVGADAVSLKNEPGAVRRLSRKPYPLKLEKEEKQELEIDGKKFNCDVRSYKSGMKVWLTADIPGGVAKMAFPGETHEVVKLSEKIVAAGKERTCVVWCSTGASGGMETREWRAEGVPGLVVKWEETVGKQVTKLELTEIKEAK